MSYAARTVGTDEVKRYYEANTKGFLRFGQGGKVGAIHRAVWGPGVHDRTAAFHFVEDRLLEHMGDARRVLDLGCGVGASLQYLAQRRLETEASSTRAFEGIGVTLSPLQVRLANERFAGVGLGSRLTCIEADFTRLPADIGDVDFAYGIESFVLGPDPEAFFRQAHEVLRSGGTLAVCDDFASPRVERERLDAREARWIREFKRGWHAHSLVSVRQAMDFADAAGFVRVADEDLTDYVELRRPRDRVITAMVRLGRHLPVSHPWWMNLVGGNALQMALVRRLINYRLLVWRKP